MDVRVVRWLTKDLVYRWTDMILFYSVSSHRSWEGFGGGVPPFSEEISTLDKITNFSFKT